MEMLILLAAVEEGLGGAFVGVWDQVALQNLLGIPEHFLPIGVTMVGHGAPDMKSPSLKTAGMLLLSIGRGSLEHQIIRSTLQAPLVPADEQDAYFTPRSGLAPTRR